MHHTDLPTTAGDRARARRPRGALARVAVIVVLAVPTLAALASPVGAADAPRALGEAATLGDRVGGGRAEADGRRALLLLDGADGAAVEAIALDARAELRVEGLLAELRLEQRFRNASDRWLDARYLFPLPADAALRALTIVVGERRIEGRVLPRDEARARFAAAGASGRVAAVVDRERPNLFGARVANVAPGAELAVTLDLVLPVAVRDGALRLVLPTTLTPRYTNATTPDPQALAAPMLPPGSARGARLTLAARIAPLDAGARVSSPTHALARRADGTLALAAAPMDRDVVLRWPLPGGRLPRASAFTAAHAGERYAQILLLPPERAGSAATAPPRELLLLIDTSGSMAGESIRAARAAALFALEGLGADDRFNLIAFDDTPQALFERPRRADAANLAAARAFVAALEAGGGTEMAPALARALGGRAGPLARPTRASPRARAVDGADRPALHRRRGDADATVHHVGMGAGAPRLRQVVFLTDGSVGDEDALLAQIGRDIGDARLYTVAIGSAPNRWFMSEAAEIGRGSALDLRDASEVLPAVTALFAKLAAPVLTDVALEFVGGAAEHYPERVPDLHAGEPLLLVARLGAGVGRLVVRGRHGDAPFRRDIALPTPERDARPRRTDLPRPAPALAMRWAQAKVETLENAERLAADPGRHRDAITELALATGLVTRYTSLVAVETAPSRPAGAPQARADVAGLLPHGNAMTTIALPAGALGVGARARVALLACALALLLLAAGRGATTLPTGRRPPRREP